MTQPKQKVLFYYLSAFSNNGGIEKFNQCFIKALSDLSREVHLQADIVSVYDGEPDSRYLGASRFKGFGKMKTRSLLWSIKEALSKDVFIIGHINLVIAGWVVKLIKPACKVIVITHGIEAWSKMSFIKKWCIRKSDLLLSVSNYTKNQLVLRNNIDASKIRLFPNTIDPFFKIPKQFEKPDYLLKKYGFKKNQPVIFTLSRLVSSERYKGYDTVIASLPDVLKFFPDAVYVLAGRYDENENLRIHMLIRKFKLEKHVLVVGFIKDEEVADHYSLADVFIMPSRKEGFGIVFLESIACGTPVIGGNQDGTVDALKNGTLGVLINPSKVNEVSAAIIQQLNSGNVSNNQLQKKVIATYGFDIYKSRLATVLAN